MIISIIKFSLVFLLGLLGADDQPVFKGGESALEQFINTNKVYPVYSKRNCIEGVIYVSFNLNKDGQVSNVKAKQGLGVDLDDEAIRLIKLTTHKWDIPKNYSERSEMVVPIKFTLQNYNCSNLTANEIAKSIEAYKTRQALEDAIINYYKNKYAGLANTKNEQEIINLKADLGYDAELVEELLVEAKKKLKQGDKDGACETLNFIKNIGFTDADDLIAQNCK
ncbi:TonB family protein [Pedobacter alpinus]|uniref:TonB family protein n=1 Tax=Pedobacter alpinus TaxID=1590643 RepID=A0ABW5TRY6_9SPHI